MDLYAVVFDPDEETTQSAIDHAKVEFEGDYFSLCSNVLLIKYERSARSLSRKLKLSKESDYTAIVFHLDEGMAGYYYTSAWRWLEEFLEEQE